jgi:hypothetical protein
MPPATCCGSLGIVLKSEASTVLENQGMFYLAIASGYEASQLSRTCRRAENYLSGNGSEVAFKLRGK